MKTSDAQKRAQARYDAQNAFRVTLKLNRKTDADLIELLENVPSKQGLIREALRAYGKMLSSGTCRAWGIRSGIIEKE